MRNMSRKHLCASYFQSLSIINCLSRNIIVSHLGAGLCVGVGPALLPMALSPSLPNILLLATKLELHAFGGIWGLLVGADITLEEPPKSPATVSNLLN